MYSIDTDRELMGLQFGEITRQYVNAAGDTYRC